MIDISQFKKLKKEEMITEYEKAIEEYEELENDYDAAIESNNELYSENSELKDELEETNKEGNRQDDYLEKKLRDIKFGTDLQNEIIKLIFKFAEEQGFRFEALDLHVSAEEVSSNLKDNLRLTNQIGDLIVSYFED